MNATKAKTHSKKALAGASISYVVRHAILGGKHERFSTGNPDMGLRKPNLVNEARSSVGRKSFGGFTLVELLVVIAIIAILSAILLPALSSARQTGKRISCASNMRQLNIAVQGYVSDFNGFLPEIQNTISAHPSVTTFKRK